MKRLEPQSTVQNGKLHGSVIVNVSLFVQSEINSAVYYAAKAGDNVKLNELISNNGMLIDLKLLNVSF